jgi:hypothetical protein
MLARRGLAPSRHKIKVRNGVPLLIRPTGDRPLTMPGGQPDPRRGPVNRLALLDVNVQIPVAAVVGGSAATLDIVGAG